MSSKKERKLFHPLIEEYINDPDATSQKSHSTLRNYAYNIQKFADKLDKRGKALPDLTKQDLADFIQEMKERDLSTSTIMVNMWSIKTFAKWLNEKDTVSDKEYRRIEKYWPNLPKNEDIKTRALSAKEIKKVNKKIHDPILSMLFWVGVNYGLRNSEYCKLEIQDVDLKAKKLHIRNAKRNKDRRIPILDEHVKIWDNWFETRAGYTKITHNFVFFSSNGKITPRTMQRYFSHMGQLVYADQKDLWFTTHDLRRTFATNLYQDGMSLNTIRYMMGHKSINTTQIYLRIEEDEMFKDYRNHFKNGSK